MELRTPVIITPRLLPGVQVGDAFVSIAYDGMQGGRTRYRYFIDLPGSKHSGNDLRSGCQGGGLQQGLESLLAFLSACGESYASRMRTSQESENEDLFEPEVAEWAYQNSDELGMLQYDLSETEGLIVE